MLFSEISLHYLTVGRVLDRRLRFLNPTLQKKGPKESDSWENEELEPFAAFLGRGIDCSRPLENKWNREHDSEQEVDSHHYQNYFQHDSRLHIRKLLTRDSFEAGTHPLR